MTLFFDSAGQRRKCIGVLAARLTDRSAYHHLEDLVLAEARRTDGDHVLVGHLVCVLGNLLDQGRNGLAEAGILKRSSAQRGWRFALASEHAGDELAMQLRDLNHNSQPSRK